MNNILSAFLLMISVSVSCYSGEIKPINGSFGAKYNIDGKEYWLPSVIKKLDSNSASKELIDGIYLNSLIAVYVFGAGNMLTVGPYVTRTSDQPITKSHVAVSSLGLVIMGVGIYLGVRVKRKFTKAVNAYNSSMKSASRNSNLNLVLESNNIGARWSFK